MVGKVSLLTPCYNGVKYEQLYIDNIKRQDYPSVEVIFINDGSTDNVESMVERIEKVVKDKGYEFVYLSKENGGAASAINLGLQHVTGDYLMLLDMDDELFEKAISAKAEYLNMHVEQDAVISNGYYVFEDKRRKTCPFIKGNKVDKDTIFERLLVIDFYNWPGSYMVRCDCLFELNGGREIFQSPYGQNLQILLPATYRKRVGFLDQHLMNYHVRKHSVSHTDDKSRMLQLVNGYETIRSTVVKKICKEEEMSYYLRLINVACIKQKLKYACRVMDKEELGRQYKKLQELDASNFFDTVIYFCGKNVLLSFLYKIVIYIAERVTNKVI